MSLDLQVLEKEDLHTEASLEWGSPLSKEALAMSILNRGQSVTGHEGYEP